MFHPTVSGSPHNTMWRSAALPQKGSHVLRAAASSSIRASSTVTSALSCDQGLTLIHRSAQRKHISFGLFVSFNEALPRLLSDYVKDQGQRVRCRSSWQQKQNVLRVVMIVITTTFSGKIASG